MRGHRLHNKVFTMIPDLITFTMAHIFVPQESPQKTVVSDCMSCRPISRTQGEQNVVCLGRAFIYIEVLSNPGRAIDSFNIC